MKFFLLLLLVVPFPGKATYRVEVERKNLNAFVRGQTSIVLITKTNCRDCRVMEKRLERVAKRLRDFRFSVMNEDKRNYPRLPVLLLYRADRLVGKKVGVLSEPKLRAWIVGLGR